MPSDQIKSMAKKADISVSEAEEKWEEAKKQAKEAGHDEEYDYIMGIFKNMIGLDESTKVKTFKEFMNENREYSRFVHDNLQAIQANMQAGKFDQKLQQFAMSAGLTNDQYKMDPERDVFTFFVEPETQQGRKIVEYLEGEGISYEVAPTMDLARR